MKKDPSNELLGLITESTIATLREIDRLHICHYAQDAVSAVREGAVLLAISRADNDSDGDGFRYLIGLRVGTEATPHLSYFFQD